MSKRCGECEQIKLALEDSAEFRISYKGHQDICSATHVGSSGAMEVKAADANCLATSLSSEHLAYFTDYRRTYFRKKRKSANFKVAQQKIKRAKLRRLKTEKTLGPMHKSGC
ncbi:hypothetical protein TNCV_4886601 [Trichonephila clavipes]|uniref:Uncharacterized protein n=1 Tax=Trichonephila clavipes TaxID=2585209 RepID=A0A8X6RNB0_TRICX|nr:hypothetical protein TNCV_4886601 [Trichonephila clavipes]